MTLLLNSKSNGACCSARTSESCSHQRDFCGSGNYSHICSWLQMSAGYAVRDAQDTEVEIKVKHGHQCATVWSSVLTGVCRRPSRPWPCASELWQRSSYESAPYSAPTNPCSSQPTRQKRCRVVWCTPQDRKLITTPHP